MVGIGVALTSSSRIEVFYFLGFLFYLFIGSVEFGV